jgi:hypothetical protein
MASISRSNLPLASERYEVGMKAFSTQISAALARNAPVLVQNFPTPQVVSITEDGLHSLLGNAKYIVQGNVINI